MSYREKEMQRSEDKSGLCVVKRQSGDQYDQRDQQRSVGEVKEVIGAGGAEAFALE